MKYLEKKSTNFDKIMIIVVFQLNASRKVKMSIFFKFGKQIKIGNNIESASD